MTRGPIALGLALVATGLVTAAAAVYGAPAPPVVAVHMTLTVDDRRVAVFLAERDRERVDVPLAAVVKPLGWRLTHAGAAWELRGEGHTFVLHPASRNVTDGGAVAVVLRATPDECEHSLCVAADDLATLFGVRVRVARDELFLSTTVLDATVAVSERAKPPARVARAAATPAPTPAPYGSSGTDRVAVTVYQRGGARTYGLAVTTVGTIRTGFSFTDGGMPVAGTATIGVPDHNVSLGASFDPLTGVVFHDAGMIGTNVHQGAYDVFAGRRLRDGRTTAGVARTRGTHTDFVELLRRPGGAFDQLVAGRRVDQVTSWGVLREEVFVSAKGLGAGVYARTRGRFYGELTAATAGGGLPLESGDAPVVGDGAYDLSRAMTARAGFAAGKGQRLSPFIGLLEHGSHLGGTVTFASRFAGLSASYANAGANAQAAISRSSGSTSYAFRSSAQVRGSAFEVAVDADDVGDRTFTAEMRFPRRGFDLFAGIESTRTNGETSFSPLAGLALPLMRGLDLEASIAPVGSKPGVRLSLVAGFSPARRAPRTLVVPLTLDLDGGAPESIAVFVDGFRLKPAALSGGHIDVSVGKHTIRIESADGARGSPEREIDTANVREASLPLWPIRTIAGRIAIDAPASLLPRDLSLAGIAVVLDPGGIPATVDDDGRFAFPSAPIGPGAVVRVDETSLPAGLAALGTTLVAPAGDVVVRVGSDRRVEKVTFPKS